MTVLDLFSGIGGFSLGLHRAGMRTIAFCEIEPYCRRILAKNFPGVPVFDDIRKLHGSDLPAPPRLVCGGYPCQPFSVAGKQRGAADDRHLWPEMFRIVQEVRPDWVIGENVAGHINMGLDQVLSDLESAGYATQAFVIPACAVNAPHRRDRVWTIAHANHEGEPDRTINAGTVRMVCNTEHDGSLAAKIAGESVKTSQRCAEGKNKTGEPAGTGGRGKHAVMADSGSSRMPTRLPGSEQWQEREPEKPDDRGYRFDGWTQYGYWSTESCIRRVADGIPDRVDRIKALGNAVVPQIVEAIGRIIMTIDS